MARPKKRAMPGSVYRRASRDTLYIKFKGKEISTGFKDTPAGWKLANQKLEDMYVDNLRSKGELPPSQEILDHYKAYVEHKQLRVSERTLKDYKKSIERCEILKCNLNKIEIENCLDDFVNKELRAMNLHPRSIIIHLRAISTFLNFLHSRELIPKIQMSKFKPEGGQKEYMSYSEEEFTMLYDYFESKDREFALMLKFMRISGSRRKETLELRWDQINFKKRTISFPVKNRRMQIDTFPITKEIEELFLELGTMNKEKLFRWKESSSSMLSRKLIAAEEELGIKQEGRGFHGLRKSFAESLFSNNKSMPVTRRLMRHKNIDTTIKHYNNYTDTELLSELEDVRQMSPTPPVNLVKTS